MPRVSGALLVLLLALALVLVLAVVPAAARHDAGLADPGVLSAFDDLRGTVQALPPSTLARGQRTSLLAKLRSAEAAYRRGQPCVALNVLGAYLHETQALRRGPRQSVAEELYAHGRLLRADVARTLPAGARCAGHHDTDRAAEVTVLESDNRHVRGRIRFGSPRLLPVQGDGETFTQVMIPGTLPVGQPGLPGVPVVRRLVAFPRGSDVSVLAVPPVVAETLRLNLHPFQPEPADQSSDPVPDPFGDRPFVRDAEAYATPGPVPAELCSVRPLGQIRDLPIAQLECAAGQYDPVTDRLALFRSLEFEVRFGGGGDFFVTRATLGAFEPPPEGYVGAVINGHDVLEYVDHGVAEPRCAGEELLILTPPDLAGAAEGLATWKRTKGIATTVVQVPASATAAEIDAFIEERFDTCTVRLSSVLLFGDAEFLPTFYPATEFAPKTGSDYRYAAYPQFFLDVLPDFAVGRLPVDALQAWAVVDKIIGYESAPPTDAAFYRNASVAAQFQCCRWDVPLGAVPVTGWDQRGFVETAEFVRDLLQGQGYTVQRIYTETEDPLYTKFDKTPRRYHDGTLLPADLGHTSGFAWNGSTQDVVDAFNQGRFLFLHRDHGSWNRWSHPELTKDEVDARLSNGDLLPVVLSLNCSTGFFDNETNPAGDRPLDPWSPYPHGAAVQGESYFAERLLRLAGGGAVAVIGATRDSPSWANNALTRGFFDALWPSALPAYGPATSTRRLGEALNYAKLYVFTEMSAPGADVDVSPAADALSELFLWHVLGDPTLEMWTARPAALAAHHGGLEWLEGALRVRYEVEGAVITALQVVGGSDTTSLVTVPLGRAEVRGGEATLPFVVPPMAEGTLLLSACARGHVCRPLLPPGGGDVIDPASPGRMP